MATEKRKKREAKVKVKAKTKVTIVTGFLGSGKTTFIKHVIKGIRGTSGQGRSHKDKVKIAAIVNDFAEFNVDAELVGALHAEPGHSSGRRKGSAPLELSNGCVCCTIKDDFIVGVLDVIESQKPELILLETSGVSDPYNITAALRQSRELSELCQLDAVITLVDASNFQEMYVKSLAMQNQIRAADVFLLNKVDLATEDQVEQVRGMVEKMHAGCRVLKCVRAAVPIPLVIDVDTSSPSVSVEREGNSVFQLPGFHLELDALGSMTFKSTSPFCLRKFQHFLLSLARNSGVVRAKGFVSFSLMPSRRYELHLVGDRYEVCEVVDDVYGVEESVAIVLIGTGIKSSELRQRLQGCVDHYHEESDAASASKESIETFRAMIAEDKRFSLCPSPSPLIVAFTLNGTYGSFGKLSELLVEAANRELSVRLSKHSLFMLTGKERNIFVFPLSSLANVSQWRTALGRETFVVLSNLVDPQQQALYSN